MYRFFTSICLFSNFFSVHFCFLFIQMYYLLFLEPGHGGNDYGLLFFLLQLSLSASNLLDLDIASKVYFLWNGCKCYTKDSKWFSFSFISRCFMLIYVWPFFFFLKYLCICLNILTSVYARQSNHNPKYFRQIKFLVC